MSYSADKAGAAEYQRFIQVPKNITDNITQGSNNENLKNQKFAKIVYIVNPEDLNLSGSGAAVWGNISGNIENQIDLIEKFDNYQLIFEEKTVSGSIPEYTVLSGDMNKILITSTDNYSDFVLPYDENNNNKEIIFRNDGTNIYYLNTNDSSKYIDNDKNRLLIPPKGSVHLKYNHTNLNWIVLNEQKIYTNVEIPLSFGMDRSTVQQYINCVPKNNNGFDITFQCSDGIYSMSDTININDFYGSGVVQFLGNSSDNTLSTSKQVIFQFFNNNNGFDVLNCSCLVRIFYLRIEFVNDPSVSFGVIASYTPGAVQVFSNYILGSTTSRGSCIAAYWNSFVYGFNNYVSNAYAGILTTSSRFYSNTNDDTGISPQYGLIAETAGTIGKNSTQPAGSVSNEFTSSGGEIR